MKQTNLSTFTKNKECLRPKKHKKRRGGNTDKKRTKQDTRWEEQPKKKSFLKEEDKWYIYVKSFLELAKESIDLLDQNKYIIISINYNFNHALELILKQILIKTGEKGVNIKQHSLDELTNKIDKEKKQKKLNKNVKNKFKEIKNIIIEQKESIYKNKKAFSIIDENNEIFKYPVAMSPKIEIDPEAYVKSFDYSEENIESLKKNIEKTIKIAKIISSES